MSALQSFVKNRLGIRSWADVRNLIHVWAPVVGSALIGASALGHEQIITAIVGVVVAVSSPLLARANTVDGFRQWAYPVLAALVAANAAVGYVIDNHWFSVASIVLSILGGGIASENTPSTSGFWQSQLGVADPSAPVQK